MEGAVRGFRVSCSTLRNMWVAPKIRDTFLEVPIIRTIVFWSLYWGPLILGNYHVALWKYES